MPEHFKRKWTIPILILGALAGAFLIAPFLNLQINPDSTYTSPLHETAKVLHINVDVLAGAILGGVISLFFIPLVFYQDPEIKHGFKILETGGWNEFLHPTTLPLSIAILWLLLLAGFAYLSDKFNIALPDYAAALAGIPISFLFGLSGFQMVKKNEVVGPFGIVYKGLLAYLNGVLFIMFGWGGLLYLILVLTFRR